MALLVRIDVDRPYGRNPLPRHVFSRLTSDLGLPRLPGLGYLRELQSILQLLNVRGVQAWVFFRRCTFPDQKTMALLDAGGHRIGLHLEDSRSFSSFLAEKERLEHHVQRKVSAFSKHGSGGAKYGLRHHAPYEPERYLKWGGRSGMELFLGNGEDPSVPGSRDSSGMQVFPAAFWLEPHWRDVNRYPVDWLIRAAANNDKVLLLHPENVLADSALTGQLIMILDALGTQTHV